MRKSTACAALDSRVVGCQALRAPEGMPSGSEPIPRPVRFHTPVRPQVGAPGHGRPRSVPQHPGRRTRPLDEAAFDQYAVRHDRISRGSPFVRRSKPTMPRRPGGECRPGRRASGRRPSRGSADLAPEDRPPGPFGDSIEGRSLGWLEPRQGG